MPPPNPRSRREDQKLQKKSAGTKSGLVRKRRSELRLSIIQAAYARLIPTYKYQPFSDDAIGTLREAYLYLLGKRASRPRLPPTESELSLLAAEVSSTTQLPETDRIEALQKLFFPLGTRRVGGPASG